MCLGANLGATLNFTRCRVLTCRTCAVGSRSKLGGLCQGWNQVLGPGELSSVGQQTGRQLGQAWAVQQAPYRERNAGLHVTRNFTAGFKLLCILREASHPKLSKSWAVLVRRQKATSFKSLEALL